MIVTVVCVLKYPICCHDNRYILTFPVGDTKQSRLESTSVNYWNNAK